MLTRTILLMSACLSLLVFQSFAQISKENSMSAVKSKDSPTLPGKWKVIGCQLNGVWLPTPIFENFIYSFADTHHFNLAWGDLSFSKYVGGFPKSDSGTISLNTDTTPNTIDLVPNSGPFAGQTFKGIFELDHDILKANFGLPGNERPQVFSAQEGQVYEVWQRL
jgi:uncharacterized protein (TIGR03067 family)